MAKREVDPETVAIDFELTDDLFKLTLDGEPITPRQLELYRSYIDPQCPFCNNAAHGEITRAAIKGLPIYYVKAYFGIKDKWQPTESEWLHHVKHHVYPVAGYAIAEAYDVEQITAQCDVDRAVLADKDARLAKLTDGQERDPRRASINFAARVQAKPSRRILLARGSYWIDGDSIQKPRMWGVERMKNELMERQAESVVFLDEMVKLHKKASRIYDEIMEEGDVKLYGTAIAAIREMRGCIETVGKMGLIAKRLGEKQDGLRKLSDPMKDLIDKLGILKDKVSDGQMPPREDAISVVADVERAFASSDDAEYVDAEVVE